MPAEIYFYISFMYYLLSMNLLPRCYVALILMLCLGYSACPQSPIPPEDSLKSALQSATHDTTRINLLNNLTGLYIDAENTDSALAYNEEALRLAEKSGYQKGFVMALTDRGEIYDRQGNYPAAIRIFQQALNISKTLNDRKVTANVYNFIANAHHKNGEYTEALSNQYSALKIREEIHDEQGIAWSYNNIATIYRIQGDYPAALNSLQESLKILEKFDDKKMIAIAHNTIGTVYSLQGKYPDALKSYYSSFRLRQFAGDKRDLIASYINIGDAYCDLYEKDSVTREVEVQYAPGIIYSIPRVSWLDTALSMQTKATEINADPVTEYFSIYILSGMGRINFLKKNYDESIRLYSSAYVIAESLDALELQQEIAKYLSDNYSRLNDYKNRMFWFEKFTTHKDSLFNQLKSDELTKTRLRYEFEKKESQAKAVQDKKDALAKAELSRQKKMRTIFQGGFALVLLFAGIFFYQRNNIRKEKTRSDDLLLNILPSEIASELKETGSSRTKSFEEVTVMFADFVDFTKVSEKITPEKLVEEIHTCFSAFDGIIQKHKVEKIKTIGDAYLCAGGLPVTDVNHAENVVNAALEMRAYMWERRKLKESRNEIPFELRIGIHSGPVVAGIVGVKKYAYDIWGDTVNIAARLEQNSLPGKINISSRTYALVKDKFTCTYRGKIEAKNKGEIDMYFLEV
jgi:adenylate cyclase